MKYLIQSYTHKNTDICTREKLAFSDEKSLRVFHQELLEIEQIQEVVILSTCNRVEFIMYVSEFDSIPQKIEQMLIEKRGLSLEELKEKGEVYKGKDAVKHLFLVGSSLDSLVIGETQITGQLKDAFRFSYDNGFCGQNIVRLMINTFKCSQIVRNSTNITKNPVSVASVAVAKAKEIFDGNLGGYTGVVIGAGEMGELVAKNLAKAGANIIIVNRNLEKALILAEKIENVNVVVEPFSKLKEILNSYRLLFSATGANKPIITKDMVQEVNFKRYWFDIAIPRDIEECSCKDIEVFAVDDLKEIVEKNIRQRQTNAKVAFMIVEKQVEEFYRWINSLKIEPLIKEIRLNAEKIAREEVKKAIKKGFIDKEKEFESLKLIQSCFNKFLHTPTINLKNLTNTPEADLIVQSTQTIFDINLDAKKALDTTKCDYLLEKGGVGK